MHLLISFFFPWPNDVIQEWLHCKGIEAQKEHFDAHDTSYFDMIYQAITFGC